MRDIEKERERIMCAFPEILHTSRFAALVLRVEHTHSSIKSTARLYFHVISHTHLWPLSVLLQNLPHQLKTLVVSYFPSFLYVTWRFNTNFCRLRNPKLPVSIILIFLTFNFPHITSLLVLGRNYFKNNFTVLNVYLVFSVVHMLHVLQKTHF